MAQLQQMIQTVVRTEMKPIYEQLEQVKAVVDEDVAMQAKVAGDPDSEDEEEYDDDEALARLAAAPASSAAVSSELDNGPREQGRSNPY